MSEFLCPSFSLAWYHPLWAFGEGTSTWKSSSSSLSLSLSPLSPLSLSQIITDKRTSGLTLLGLPPSTAPSKFTCPPGVLHQLPVQSHGTRHLTGPGVLPRASAGAQSLGGLGVTHAPMCSSSSASQHLPCTRPGPADEAWPSAYQLFPRQEQSECSRPPMELKRASPALPLPPVLPGEPPAL